VQVEPAVECFRPAPFFLRTRVKTEIFESDPFSPRKAALLVSVDTEYRFEKGDEMMIDLEGRTTKVRVMDVRMLISSGVLSREILALKV
jgi:hypothetical protein